MNQKFASFSTLFKKTMTLFFKREHLTTYLFVSMVPTALYYLLMLAIGIVMQPYTQNLEQEISGWNPTIWISAIVGVIIFMVVSVVVSTWYGAFMLLVHGVIAQDQPVPVKNTAREAWRKTRRFFLTQFKLNFIVIVGLLLFIIPGVKWLIDYFFTPTIAVLEEDAIDPFAESKRIMKTPHRAAILGRSILIGIIIIVSNNLLSFIYSLLGTAWSVVTTPFIGLFGILLYNEAKRKASETSTI